MHTAAIVFLVFQLISFLGAFIQTDERGTAAVGLFFACGNIGVIYVLSDM